MGNSRKGASAGGTTALQGFCRALSARPNLTAVIIQHLLSGDEMPDLPSLFFLAACEFIAVDHASRTIARQPVHCYSKVLA
jgi:chemotaxis response regulator CheB